MGKLLSLEFKKNKKLLTRILVFDLVLIILGLFFRLSGISSNLFVAPSLANGVFGLGLFYFVLVNMIYIISSRHKDLYRNSAELTFILPVSRGNFVLAKSLALGIVYIFNMLMLFVFYKSLSFRITGDLVFYFALGLMWILIFGHLASLVMQMARFKQNKIPYVLGILILVLVFALGFVVCKYFSFVLVEGAIQKAGPMNYAFVFPFAIGRYGIYKNFTSILYYIIAAIILYRLDSKNLSKNLDL